MLPAIVRAALNQRLVVVVVAIVLSFFGLDAARKLSVDAFPDVTNVQVQIATEAVGRSPEEVERFVTVPVEIAMTGLPGLTEMRSLNKPALSLITLVFTDKTNASTVLAPAQQQQVAEVLEHDAQVMSDAQLQEQIADEPPATQEEILRINDEARPQALQIALLVPLLVSLLGLGLSFRMMRLPDPAPSAA